MVCPACSVDVPEGARFCPACGIELAGRIEERRIATVLFADLVGFTTLSEIRDPEQVKRLVDRCFQKLVADITAYGGIVDKIIGDAIVALFGAPVAHEDDAERAVRAALAMQRTLAAEAAELEAPIQMRIGVNSGEVVVGSSAGGDYTAMGDVVNTANRLQTAAAPGAVVVGPATHAATRNAIRYVDLGRLEAKGRVAPVEAWQAEAAILPPGYRHRRDTPLVGRDEELGMLQHALNAAVSRSRGHLILLLGEAGVGKTRLAEEVADTAATLHDAVVLEGRCVPYGEANVWWPVAEAFRDAVGLASDAPDEVAQTVVAKAVALTMRDAAAANGTVPLDEEELERIGAGLLHLLGYETPLAALDPQRAREEANRASLVYAEASATTRPFVSILSDLHWADDVVLDMIDALMERVARLPFVLLATARPELIDRWSLRSGRHNQLVVNLDPLDREATAVLLDLLSDGDLSSEVERELLDRSGGNPFFLEELVALVGEAAPPAIIPAGDVTASVDDDHHVTHLPDTLRGLVAARLDALTPDERRLLEDAAVWGRSGKVVALERMGESDDRSDITPALASLVDKEILVVEGDTWRFRSDLVRDVAYGTLTKAHRARAHHGIAWYLESHGPEPHRADEWLVDVVAHHYAHAAELVREIGLVSDDEGAEMVERALRWVEEAAARAKGAQALPVSIRMFTQALGLVGPEACQRRADLLLSRAVALADSRRLDEARRDADEAEQIATDLGDVAALARVAFVRGIITQYEGRLDAAVEILGDAVELFREAGDRSGEADALRNIGLTEIFRDDMAGAEASITEALELYRATGDRRGEAWSLQQMAWISFMEDRAAEADERLGVARDTFVELGDAAGQAWVRGLSAYVRFQQGDLDEARTLGDRALTEARERGDRWAEGMMLLLAGSVRLWSGQATEALPYAEDALQVFRTIGDRFGGVQAHYLLGRILVTLGRMADGFRLLEAAPNVLEGDRDERLARGVSAAASIQVGDPRRAASALGPLEAGDLNPHLLGDSDRLVVVGMQRLQDGHLDDALDLLALAAEPREGTPSRPYALCGLTLAMAAAGRDESALELAEQVDGLARSTYLDRAYARLAAALVGVRRGDGEAIASLDALVGSVDATDDRVLQGVVRMARAQALHALGDDRAEAAIAEVDVQLADLGVSLGGWRRLFDAILTRQAEGSGTTRR
jgi:class 3 adenylate cyclase/tetratricopeptide (TPR) repeat protein